MARPQALAVALALLLGPMLAAAQLAAASLGERFGPAQESSDMLFGR